MTVFADTFALIAWLNPDDDAHAQVAAYLDAFTGKLVTTEWVLVELADALSAPTARGIAVALLQAFVPIRSLKWSDIRNPSMKPVSHCSPTARTKAGR
jgi:predicted nucleic acid-binding protein